MNQTKNIQFSLMSMMDDFGRVFFANNKVYRAINDSQKDYCLSLLNSDLFRELNKKKLIPDTKIADFTIDGYSLVLEHEKLLHTLQHEWTFSMIRNAALTILEVNEICNRHGYELKDGHLFNMLFRGTQPVWVDLGSIIPDNNKNGQWSAYEEFLNAVLVPMLFWSDNKHFIAHKLLESIISGMATVPSQTLVESGLLEILKFKKGDFYFKLRGKTLFKTKSKLSLFSTISQKTEAAIKKHAKRNTRVFSYKSKYDTITKLSELFSFKDIREEILNLPAPTKKSAWQSYHQDFYTKDGVTIYSERFLRILDLVKNTEDINSVIDLAGNEGYFSQLMRNELRLENIVLADYDENAIDSAYNRFRNKNIGGIHTVLLNFMFANDLQGTTKRLQSDLAIALAVTHHLLLTGGYTLPAILERLRLYSKKYVMIEFMPLGLWAGAKEYPKVPEWYTINWFRSSVEEYFDIIVEEKLEANRVLFFGKIKS